MTKKRRSLQDKLRQKRLDSFIGREEQLQKFRDNLEAGSSSYDFYNIFNIHGQGGVGKTTLLQRYMDLVKAEGHFYIYTDEGVSSVIDFMNIVVTQLQQQGLRFKEFCEQHKKLLQERQKLEADPEAPKGWLSYIASTVIKGGMDVTQEFLPGSGLVLNKIDKDGIARHGGELVEYLHKKITNKDEVKLVLYPEKVLTPLFIKEIVEYQGQQDFYFFIDTFEVVSVFLDSWIRNLIEGEFGDLPEGSVFLIAGRNELNPNSWSNLSPLIHKCSLEVFTDQEATEFLKLKKITHQQTVETILTLSQNLPILLVTLSEAAPKYSTDIRDPNDTAVDRFLKWIKDPLQKDLALFAALPRKLNQDIIEVIFEDTVDSGNLFQWLCDRPFVQKRGGYWAYHPIVRDMIIKYLYQKSLRQWTFLQMRLVHYYQKLLGDTDNWENEYWRANKIELQYHYLCLEHTKGQAIVLQDFVKVLRLLKVQATIPWVEIIVQSERIFQENQWGPTLQAGVAGLMADEYVTSLPLISKLNTEAIITENEDRAFMLYLEGVIQTLDKKFKKGAELLHKALDLNAENPDAWNNLGITYSALNNSEKAIECYQNALNLDPNDDEIYYFIAKEYSALADKKKAIEYYEKSIEVSSNYDAWFQMGIIYGEEGSHKKAIECYQHALNLEPNQHIAWFSLGLEHSQQDAQQKAMECYKRGLELEPETHEVWYVLGANYMDMCDYDEAIICTQKAIVLEQEMPDYHERLGWLKLLVGKFKEAKNSLMKAWAMEKGKNFTCSMNLGHCYLISNEKEKALKWYKTSLSLLEECKEFFEGMEEDYNDLKMQDYGIDRDDYDQILVALKGT